MHANLRLSARRDFVRFSGQAGMTPSARREALSFPSSQGDLVLLSAGPRLEITPETASRLKLDDVMRFLSRSISAKDMACLKKGELIPSPVSQEKDTGWFEQIKMVGVSPRICKTYLGILKYALTLPKGTAVHLMPVFEPGTLGNYYAQINWRPSDKWLDPELVRAGYKTPEAQLKFLTSALNALNHPVVMEMVPHTDNFSEIVFANPAMFEWIKVTPNPINPDLEPKLDFGDFSSDIKGVVLDFLKAEGNAKGNPVPARMLARFFGPETSEAERIETLFGSPTTPEEKQHAFNRRIAVLTRVRQAHFMSQPIVPDPPYRPVYFDKWIIDEYGGRWPEFNIQRLDGAERPIFGTLTAYKLYETLADSSPDASRPCYETWQYIAERYGDLQKTYGFSAMRQDMAHLQYEHYPNGTRNASTDPTRKNVWTFIKHHIQTTNKSPYFATLGETFYPKAFYDPFRHMDDQNVDVGLGYIQYLQPGDTGLIRQIRRHQPENVRHKPALAISTNDADDLGETCANSSKSNTLKTFIGFFMDHPTYMGLGLETREEQPAERREYSARYSLDEPQDYKYGNNRQFYEPLQRMRRAWEDLAGTITTQQFQWLDSSAKHVASWRFIDKKTRDVSLVMVANTDLTFDKQIVEMGLPGDTSTPVTGKDETVILEPLLSTQDTPEKNTVYVIRQGQTMRITNLAPGECRIYRVKKKSKKHKTTKVFQ